MILFLVPFNLKKKKSKNTYHPTSSSKKKKKNRGRYATISEELFRLLNPSMLPPPSNSSTVIMYNIYIYIYCTFFTVLYGEHII